MIKLSSIAKQLLLESRIKDGVDFVFEQNPELANAVYEALGFKEGNQVGENPFNTVVNFDLNKIRSVSGKLGEQGATPDGIRDLLKYVGVDLTNVNTDSIKAMADYLRSNPSERNKVLDLVKKEPIKLSQLPDGSYDLKDGNHRATILYYSGVESIPAIITDRTNAPRTEEEYTGPFGGAVSPTQETITPQQKRQAQQLYSQYLDTIFPNSKVKDIVFHSSPVKITSFTKQEQGLGQFFFSKGKDTIWKLLASMEEEPFQLAALLNIKNPKVEEFDENDHDGQTYRMRFASKEGYDAVFIQNKNSPEDSERVVFRPDQIHILGSKKDIEGFKKFVGK